MIFYLLSPRLPLAQCALLTALHPTIHPPPQLRHRAWAGPRTTCGAAGGALGPGLPPRTEAGPPGRAQWNNRAPLPPAAPPASPSIARCRPQGITGGVEAFPEFQKKVGGWVGGWGAGEGVTYLGATWVGAASRPAWGRPPPPRSAAARLAGSSLPSPLRPSSPPPCPPCPTRPLPRSSSRTCTLRSTAGRPPTPTRTATTSEGGRPRDACLRAG